MEVLNKIQAVKEAIKKRNDKREGYNKHSNYAYYTPEQVDNIVTEECNKQKLFNKYELHHSEYGLTASMLVIDLDSGKKELYTMATGLAKMTASNEAQQHGGTVTYSERYLLQTIYGIKDNNDDPDVKASYPKPEKKEIKYAEKDNELLTQSFVEKDWNGKIYKGNSVYINQNPVILSESQVKRLQSHPKYTK